MPLTIWAELYRHRILSLGNLYEPDPTWTSVSGGWLTAKIHDIPVSGKGIIMGTVALAGLLIGRYLFSK